MEEYFTPYPTYIEVPNGYWTITTTANTKEEKKDVYWHHNEED